MKTFRNLLCAQLANPEKPEVSA